MGSCCFAGKVGPNGYIHVPYAILHDYDLVPRPVLVVQVLGVTNLAYVARRRDVQGRPVEYYPGDSFPYPYVRL